MSTVLLATVNSLLTKVDGMDSFRSFIVKRAEELNLSHNEVAKRAGKTGAWLSKFLSGERSTIQLDTFVKLADALKISPVQLMMAHLGKDVELEQVTSDRYREAVKDMLKQLPKEEIIDLMRGEEQTNKNFEIISRERHNK